MVDLKRREEIVPSEAARLVAQELSKSDAPEAAALAMLVVAADKTGQAVDNLGDVFAEVYSRVSILEGKTIAAYAKLIIIPAAISILSFLGCAILTYLIFGTKPV